MGLGDLLGALLGGKKKPKPGQAPAAPDALGDLIGGLAGGQDAGGGVADLLGGLTGGQASGGGVADMVGGLMGGSQGGLGGMLGALAGGSDLSANPMVAGIAQKLAEGLGLSPQIAQTIVAFAVSKLLPAIMGGLQGAQAGRAPGDAEGGFDLGDLVQRVGQGQVLGHDYLTASGMPQELAQQAGIDEPTAERGLQQSFQLLGEELAGSLGAQGR